MNTKIASANIVRHGLKYASDNTQEGINAGALAIKIAAAVDQGYSIAEAVAAFVPPEQQIAVVDELYKAAAGSAKGRSWADYGKEKYKATKEKVYSNRGKAGLGAGAVVGSALGAGAAYLATRRGKKDEETEGKKGKK